MKKFYPKGYKTVEDTFIKNFQKPRTVRLVVKKKKKQKGYQVPKTPKTSGYGWGP